MGMITIEKKQTFHIDIEHARSTFLQLDIPLQLAPARIALVVLLLVLHRVRNEGRANSVVSRFRLRDVDAVDDRVDLGALELVGDPMGKQSVARHVLDVHDALLRVTRDLDHLDILIVDDLLHDGAAFRRQVVEPFDVDLVDDEQRGFSSEEGLDGVEQFALESSRVIARPRDKGKIAGVAPGLRSYTRIVR